MAEQLNIAVRNRQADSLGDALNSGTLKIYTGTPPANADAAATGTLLVTITLPADAFAAASGGEAAKAGTWSGTAGVTGTAGWFRLANSGATLIMDGTVTATGGGGDLELSTVSIVSTNTVTVSTFKIIQPAS